MEGSSKEGIIVVYGSPASGKSTFSQSLLQIIHRKVLLVHIDDVEQYFHSNQILNIPQQKIQQSCSLSELLLLTCTKNHKFDPQIWKKSRDFVKTHIRKFKLICDILIVQDDFLLKSTRKPYKQYAAQHQIQYLQIYMNTSLDKCLQLNSLRGLPVSQEVIKVKYQKIQITGKSLEIHERNIDQNWIIINSSIPSQVQQDQQPELHQATQLQITENQIRKYISQIMVSLKQSKTSPQKLKQISATISSLKKSHQLKQGFITFKQSCSKYLQSIL